MKTAVMIAEVCLLVLIFSTVECGSTQEKKRVAEPGGPTISTDPSCAVSGDLLACSNRCTVLRTDRSDGDDSFCSDCRSDLEDFGNRCVAPTLQQGQDAMNMLCGDAIILGATFCSIILARLVAAASTLN